LTDIENNLRKAVHFLSSEIGSRGYEEIDALTKAGDYIISELRKYGYDVSEQP